MLEVKDLVSGYKETTIINQLNLAVPQGEMLALLGRNGVGKTTLLKSIFGLCRVSEGTITAEGADIKWGKPELMAQHGYSFMPDDRGVFETLTVKENLRLARRKGYDPAVEVTELFPLLDERADQAAGSLSGGQKQQLGIARAILQGEKMIAIDEFSQGLQPSISHSTMKALKQLAETGVSVLIVEQSPDLPLEYCDRIVGMVKGRVTFDEPVDTVRAHPEELTDLLVVT